MQRALVSLVCVLVLGCGGDDDPKSLGAPTCASGELVIEGTLDGTAVSESLSGYSTFSFVNSVGDANGRFNVGFPNQNSLYIEFPDFVNDGNIVRSRGFVDLTNTGGVFGGFCDTMTLYSGELLVPKEGDQYEFTLKQLRTSVPECTAMVATGELIGCFRPRASAPDAGM